MEKNKKLLVLLVTIAVVVVGTLAVIMILTGKKGNGELSGKNDKQQTQIQEGSQSSDAGTNNGVEQTGVNEANNTNDPEGNDGAVKKEIKTVKTRALYLTGNSAGKEDVIDHIISLAKTTELNSVVIDVKEGGMVNYESDVPTVRSNGLFNKYYDPVSLIKKLHDNNIYVIGRIVCFLDDGLATKRADLAIKKTDGTPWKEGKWGTWVNPYNDEVLNYNIDIAKEAADKGFDEIQFDYVRFPSGTGTQVDYGSNVPAKADVICKFLEMGYNEIHEKKGIPLSADVFGIICLDPNTKTSIGQDLERVGMYLDYISPMVYPSHYANASTTHYTGNGVGQKINGILFTAPDLEPYKVVYNSLITAKNRILKVEGYKAKVRPYLQSFTATYLPKGYYQEYGVEQVRQQIKAVYDAGYDEWILWNSGNVYSDKIFQANP